MPIYYVDFSVDNIPGYQVNDPANPMGYYDYLGSSGASLFYAKGEREVTHTLGTLGPVQAWDLELFGPWRLKNNGRLRIDINGHLTNEVSGGIVYGTGSFEIEIYTDFYFRNMTILTGGASDLHCRDTGSRAIHFEGCTIDSLRMSPRYNYSLLSTFMKDSVFDTDLNNANGNFYWLYTDNCAFRQTQASIASVITNSWVNNASQFEWTPPSWPAWNALIEDWDAETLGYMIQTPPQPGNSPYIGYETGLAGAPRAGIGGFSFLATPASKLSVGKQVDLYGTSLSTGSTVNSGVLIEHPEVIGDTRFNNPLTWQSVMVEYRHESGQSLLIPHRDNGGNWIGHGVFDGDTQPGTWVKTVIIIIDQMGASKRVTTGLENENLTVIQH